jgi:hypothetical protein
MVPCKRAVLNYNYPIHQSLNFQKLNYTYLKHYRSHRIKMLASAYGSPRFTAKFLYSLSFHLFIEICLTADGIIIMEEVPLTNAINN